MIQQCEYNQQCDNRCQREDAWSLFFAFKLPAVGNVITLGERNLLIDGASNCIHCAAEVGIVNIGWNDNASVDILAVDGVWTIGASNVCHIIKRYHTDIAVYHYVFNLFDRVYERVIGSNGEVERDSVFIYLRHILSRHNCLDKLWETA